MSTLERLKSARDVWVKCEGTMISLNQDEVHEIMEEIDRLQKVVNDLSVSDDAYLFTGKDIKAKDKEIERLNNIINNFKKDIEVIEQIEDIEVMKMQLRNIVFRLKGSDN